MKINNKVAVVTGAASGIGFAVSKKLIESGARAVAMVDLNDQVEQAAAKIADPNIAIPFQGDVSDSSFRESVFKQVAETGLPQICVPAAGILRDAMAVKVNKETGQAELYAEQQFRQVLEINLMHPVYWSMQMMAAVAEFRATKGLGRWHSEEGIQGVATIVGSVSSRGNRGQISYASAKSGLNAAAKTLNVEGAYYGVQAKIIHPGFVETPMVEQLPDGMFEDHLRKLVLIDRMIKPAEIADAIVAMIENPIISGPIWADGGLPPMS